MQITNIELIPIYSTREMGRSLSFRFGEGNLPPHHRPLANRCRYYRLRRDVGCQL